MSDGLEKQNVKITPENPAVDQPMSTLAAELRDFLQNQAEQCAENHKKNAHFVLADDAGVKILTRLISKVNGAVLSRSEYPNVHNEKGKEVKQTVVLSFKDIDGIM